MVGLVLITLISILSIIIVVYWWMVHVLLLGCYAVIYWIDAVTIDSIVPFGIVSASLTLRDVWVVFTRLMLVSKPFSCVMHQALVCLREYCLNTQFVWLLVWTDINSASASAAISFIPI